MLHVTVLPSIHQPYLVQSTPRPTDSSNTLIGQYWAVQRNIRTQSNTYWLILCHTVQCSHSIKCSHRPILCNTVQCSHSIKCSYCAVQCTVPTPSNALIVQYSALFPLHQMLLLCSTVHCSHSIKCSHCALQCAVPTRIKLVKCTVQCDNYYIQHQPFSVDVVEKGIKRSTRVITWISKKKLMGVECWYTHTVVNNLRLVSILHTDITIDGYKLFTIHQGQCNKVDLYSNSINIVIKQIISKSRGHLHLQLQFWKVFHRLLPQTLATPQSQFWTLLVTNTLQYTIQRLWRATYSRPAVIHRHCRVVRLQCQNPQGHHS